jgi:signal peptidase I
LAGTFTLVLVLLVTGYSLTAIFIARIYTVPSVAMEPTLHGCISGCVVDQVLVNKLLYRFSTPHPGDVIVFTAPPSWSRGAVGEDDRIGRVIAVGRQIVQCRNNTGLTVDGTHLTESYLDPATIGTDPPMGSCWGIEFGPVAVPAGQLWVMGDSRAFSADSRAYCVSTPADALNSILCTGDPAAGTVPVANVVGKVSLVVWPHKRWGRVISVTPQFSH